MAFSHITHHMVKVPETQQYRVGRVTPVVRLGCMSEAVYLQGGKCYSAEGDEMELPTWAYGQMALLTPTTLQEAGFAEVPTPPGGKVEVTPQPKAPTMWQCPACEKLVEEGAKEAHIAKHNMRLGPNEQLGQDGKPRH